MVNPLHGQLWITYIIANQHENHSYILMERNNKYFHHKNVRGSRNGPLILLSSCQHVSASVRNIKWNFCLPISYLWQKWMRLHTSPSLFFPFSASLNSFLTLDCSFCNLNSNDRFSPKVLTSERCNSKQFSHRLSTALLVIFKSNTYSRRT